MITILRICGAIRRKEFVIMRVIYITLCFYFKYLYVAIVKKSISWNSRNSDKVL